LQIPWICTCRSAPNISENRITIEFNIPVWEAKRFDLPIRKHTSYPSLNLTIIFNRRISNVDHPTNRFLELKGIELDLTELPSGTKHGKT
jgi:hypothetical protein